MAFPTCYNKINKGENAKKIGGISMSKEINIIEIVYLNQNGIKIEEENHPLPFRYFNDNGSLPEGNYKENDIAGSWVVVKGRHEIGTFAYRSIDDCTLIKEEGFRNYQLLQKLLKELDQMEKNQIEEIKQHYKKINEMLKKLLKEELYFEEEWSYGERADFKLQAREGYEKPLQVIVDQIKDGVVARIFDEEYNLNEVIKYFIRDLEVNELEFIIDELYD